MAQILFRVLMHEGVVPLTGTRSQEHMIEDLALGEFAFSAEECIAISALFAAPA